MVVYILNSKTSFFDIYRNYQVTAFPMPNLPFNICSVILNVVSLKVSLIGSTILSFLSRGCQRDTIGEERSAFPEGALLVSSMSVKTVPATHVISWDSCSLYLG